MVNKKFCDRCGSYIPPTMRHSEVELNDDHHGSYHDYCDRCTQSLKMWMHNLPNREVKYIEAYPSVLEDGTFADVFLRVSEGASSARFHRRSWPEGNCLGFWMGHVNKEFGIKTKFVRIISEDGYSELLTDEDIKASDWCESRPPMPDDKDEGEDEGDEEGDE